ncbi:uncharacterized protein LOC128858442 [Anastrepha ludens]|uniref:uncharacterized protein LOC128858442 n=1 Tax=Anastrepha ludens TaxID=28586 RepID=UPI0023B07339|nr:uncharacterized protein LOC128858442 [Anastrepha ludens]XP_053950697.1 uncharacterized protein LOC128858442 [Anastrepha ludens]
MIRGECAHKIVVDNLENGEIINHTLLLIKGHIHQQLRSLPINTSKKCGEQQIVLRLRQLLKQHENNVEISAWELKQQAQISRNGQFKLLLDLGQHVSVTEHEQVPLQLDFNFCNAVHQLELSYESSDNHYRLQPLYITCYNQNPPAEYVRENLEKINLNLRLVQCVYSEQLKAAGFGRHTFKLNGDCEGFETRLTCEEVWQQNENSLWQNFAQELLNSTTWGGETKLKFVAFIGCTKYNGAEVAASGDFSYENIRRHLKGHAALGGGGLALFGAAYLYSWPHCFNKIHACFSSNKEVDLTQFPDDSNYRRTYGGVYATTLGAVVHEIGHTFDLGHTKDGVMGNGFDYINRIFTVDNLTEYLPDRIIHHELANVTAHIAARPRFTQLKRTNTFLEKYHEQKTTDSFYFTRNCAIILSQHKWFRNYNKSADEEQGAEALITYDAFNSCVISAGDNHPLCLIEVRCTDSSLVKYWYEFQSDKNNSAVYKFHLTKEAREALENNHYLFVLTQTGLVKRLCES